MNVQYYPRIMTMTDKENPAFDMYRIAQLHKQELSGVDTTPLTREEAYKLFVEWLQLGALASRDRLFFSLTGLVHRLADELDREGRLDCEKQDAISEGYVVILDKLNSWNPDIAMASTHSHNRIRGAMQNLSQHERRHGLTGDQHVSDVHFTVHSSHGRDGLELWDFAAAIEEQVDALQQYVDHVRLHEQIDQLPEKLRLVIQMLYFDDMTQEEVAEALKITQQAVSAREQIAIEKLQRYFLYNRRIHG
jgi:RNA polymerase sigma factor (sigma-70 family)